MPEPQQNHDIIRSTNVDESAAFCIDELARHYGRFQTASDLKGYPWLRKGRASLREIAFLAEQIGINTRIVRLGEDELRLLRLPAVVALSGYGACILQKTRGSRVLLARHGRPSTWYFERDVMARLEGDAIETSPPGPFELSAESRTPGLYGLVRDSAGLRSGLTQLAILSIVMQAIVLIGPYFLQLLLDRVVPTQDIRLLAVLALGFGALALISAFATGLRVLVVTAAGTSLGFDLSSALFRRMVVLPLEWFEKRELGQILVSFRSTFPIQKTLAENGPLIVIDGLLGITNLVVMYLYSTPLALISTAAFALYSCTRLAFFRSQRALQDASLKATGAEHAVVLETLRSMKTIRSLGLERLRHAMWQAAQMRSTNADFRFRTRAGWQDAVHAAVYGVENVAVVGLGAYLVIADKLSVGMLFAYLVYKAQFLTAGASLVEKTLEMRLLNVHLARIDDIVSERPMERLSGPSVRPFRPISGRIEVSNVVHRFGSDREPVLKGIDLLIAAGEALVITGPSGSGKSTLAKVLVGLVLPQEGKVIIDGAALDAPNFQNFRLQVASVLQEDRLLSGTIAENVSAFDEDPNADAIMEVARIAGMLEEIDAMPLGFATRIGDLETGLSGGQRQRLLIARALYRRPKILLLDEATSQLDELREREINEAIAKMGMTRVVIAHRRATIDAADRVVVLEGGRISSDTRRS